jgi:hypothetical protein
MNATKATCLLAGLLALGGCASWSMPSAERFAQMPLVRFGAPIPANQDYILHFPAGEPVPVNVLAQGNLFTQEVSTSFNVVLARDIYEYRQWISYDRKHWIDGRENMELIVEIKVPGYDYPKPGSIRIKMDAR